MNTRPPVINHNGSPRLIAQQTQSAIEALYREVRALKASSYTSGERVVRIPGFNFKNFQIIEVLSEGALPELHILAKVNGEWKKKWSIDTSDPDATPGW